MIDSPAYNRIMARLDKLEEIFTDMKKKADTPLGEKWLDNQDVCQLLYISKRTLQSYRDNNLLPYSQINNNIYYKASDIAKFLKKHYRTPRNF